MITAFITWFSVVALICVILSFRFVVFLIRHSHRSRRNRVISLSNEREMLFVPGDCMYKGGKDIDYDPDEM